MTDTDNVKECVDCGEIYEGEVCPKCAPAPTVPVEAPKPKSKPAAPAPPVLNKNETVLEQYLQEYAECTKEPTPKNLKRSINIFIKICTHLINERDNKLYKTVYQRVFKTPGAVLAPQVVFAYLHENLSSEKSKYTTLYTTLAYLAEYQNSSRGKKRGFTLDFERMTEQYGCDSLTNFVKTQIR